TSSATGGTSGKTLVVDQTFDLKTSDPGRAFELTGSIVDKALYETALTFTGGDLTKAVPQLTTFSASPDNTVLTLTLQGQHAFSSGNPVTIDDIVWSYQRVQGIAGNPSFLLQDPAGKNLVIAKTSDTTMTLTSTVANPALPFILPNPSLGVLDSKTLTQHGGTTTKDDKAESYLNGTSAGSGPYQLESYDVTTKVVFATNAKHTGSKPAYSRVVLQNVTGPSQKIDVQGGQAQLATGLNSQQVAGLASSTITVAKTSSANVGYMWLNQNAQYSGGVTNNSDFLTAMRKGIDYNALLAVAGEGSTQPGGIVPSQFVGAIKPDATTSFDLAAAKAALSASGYSGQEVKMTYPTDATLDGIQFATLAQKVQAQLKEVGVNVALAGTPIATLLDAYRAGTLQAGLMYWGPDYPDPSDYTTFSPGDSLGKRAGWAADMAPEVTTAKNAAIAASGDGRAAAYEAWQHAANKVGPFIPLIQAARYYVSSASISGVVPNAVWSLDLALVK
ncbi:MAG: ABC transporter substrate-binding protein, partial [Actinomycetota bacterium]|nr:ABC transporter substrate-binding protein [Actinomycetota bacterium]